MFFTSDTQQHPIVEVVFFVKFLSYCSHGWDWQLCIEDVGTNSLQLAGSAFVYQRVFHLQLPVQNEFL